MTNLTDKLRHYITYPDDAGRATLPVALIQEVIDALDPPHGKPEKLRIYVNRKIRDTASTNKIAAHAVHAALTAFGVHPGVKVVVLDKGPTQIEKMRTVIHDAGHTELEPDTLTTGTNWPLDSEE